MATKRKADDERSNDEVVEHPPAASLPGDNPGDTVVGPVGPPVEPPAPKVKLEDWVALSAAGGRSSRFAGFAAFAKRKGLKSATDAEYRALFKDFLKAPVR